MILISGRPASSLHTLWPSCKCELAQHFGAVESSPASQNPQPLPHYCNALVLVWANMCGHAGVSQDLTSQ
jgi:hypothetical protein